MTDDVDEETSPSRRDALEEQTTLGRRRRDGEPPAPSPRGGDPAADAVEGMIVVPPGLRDEAREDDVIVVPPQFDELLDEDTAMGRPRAHEELLDDDTRVVAREEEELDLTRVVRRPPADATRRSLRRQRRRDSPPEDAPGEDPTPRRRTAAIDLPALDPDDGSTFVARRESRRRAASGGAPVDDTVIVRGRASAMQQGAVSPTDHRDRSTPPSIYQPRAIPTSAPTRDVSVARRAEAPIDVPPTDAGRRRGRRRLRIAVVAASVGFVVLAALLVVLLATTWG